MDENLAKSLDYFLFNALRHCNSFRLSNYDLSALKPEEARALASQMLDHFEQEIDRLGDKISVGPKGSAQSGSGTPVAFPLERFMVNRPDTR